MNLTPTEMDRLTIFAAAEMARRNKAHGVRLSHPEAVAYLTDECMFAARRDMDYEDIRDMAGRLLTTADVEPGVADMVKMIYFECPFAEGTKAMALFEPIGPAEGEPKAMIPGEIVTPDEEIELFADRAAVELEVTNTGDRDIQVRSHSHFFEVNRALQFDRALAWGMKLDRPSGLGVRFEPGMTKTVRLVAFGGNRQVIGEGGLAQGPLDRDGAREAALARAAASGYLGS
ncbi:Urease subunit alpha [Marinibacterium anthonyi]|nr:Urease subunit alpha [Marinibacterium anthonyi]